MLAWLTDPPTPHPRVVLKRLRKPKPNLADSLGCEIKE